MAGSEPIVDLVPAIRARLLASPELLALIPPDHIGDSTGRPERMPSINIGEGQTIYGRFTSTAYAQLHLWFEEPGLAKAQTAAGLIVDLLRVDAQISGVLALPNFICHDLAVTQTRFMRDSAGPYSHGIVSVAAIMKAK